MIKRLYVAITLLFALFALDLLPSQLAAQSQPPNYVPDEIIVKYRDGIEESKKDLARFRVVGQRKKEFKLTRGLEVVKLGRNVSVAEAIDLLKQDPDVLYAEPNYILHLTAKPTANGNPAPTATPNDPSFGSLWGLTKIKAPDAWNLTTGSDQVFVVVIDTGIDYTHPDLAANMGLDADGNYGLNVAYGTTDPMDDHYHGTHVAGTIGAVGNNGTGVVGVNWNVKLLACKFFDAFGSATTEGAIECLDYVKDMKARGINIVATNNSWVGDENSQALYDAIAAQRDAGILFIAGAGNSGLNNDTSPFYPCKFYLANIICVAATNSSDGRPSFSNYGRRTVHVGAPGNNILSTMPGGQYGSLSGTSMATPHVAGLAALLKARAIEDNLNWDWREIKNLILTGGDTIKSMANTITGKRINANGSMICTNTVVQSRIQPVLTTISASPGVPVDLGYLNIKCATPNGPVSVSVSSGGSITLLDDGAGADQASGDGIYSGQWTPTATGTYTLTFPGNDNITVNVANPTISVTPSSLDFGGASVNSFKDKTFTVSNTGGGVLAGTATTNLPYSIVSGGTYNLSGGQSQVVTVRFSPTSTGSSLGSVTLTGGAGATVALSGNGVVPPTLSFTFDGKLVDRVGQGDTARNSDGLNDGTMTVAVQPGSGTRTVTRMELRSGTGGIWNTTPDGNWILGAAPTLSASLYNDSSAQVSFAITDGSSFKLFAADEGIGIHFPVGGTLTLTVDLSDGSTATVSSVVPSPPPPPSPPTLSLSFDGNLRDRVGRGDTALSPDGTMDGTLTVVVQPGSGNRTVTQLELRTGSGAGWNTTPGGYWILGAAPSLDGALYNSSNGSVNFAVIDGSSFTLFAGEASSGTYFPVGATLTLTVKLSDGSTATATAIVPSPPPPPPGPTLSMSFDGKLRDRVGRGDAALGADGTMDGTMTVILQAGSGARTVTGLTLQPSTGGVWNTSPDNYWVLGAAPFLDGTLYNNLNGTVNFQVSDGGGFKIFAGDASSGTYFPAGATLTLTVKFSDGSTASTTAIVPSILSMSFDGKLRDRVGRGDAALGADGTMDGTMTVTLQAGSGARTVTGLTLQPNTGGVWNTSPDNYWVLGAAPFLDGTLYNNLNGTVNFAISEGGSFKVFAGDAGSGTYFPVGSTMNLRVNFSDGNTVTVSAVVP